MADTSILVREPIWKPVVGFEGFYEVSDTGLVRSLDRHITYDLQCRSGETKSVTRFKRGTILKPTPKDSGHLLVSLGRGTVPRSVHSLVLEAFVGPRPEGMNGLHENDDPADNRLENLYWGTQSQNAFDAIRNGKKKVGDDYSGSKLRSAEIPVIRAAIRSGQPYHEIASRYGVSTATIQNIQYGKAWRHVA